MSCDWKIRRRSTIAQRYQARSTTNSATRGGKTIAATARSGRAPLRTDAIADAAYAETSRRGHRAEALRFLRTIVTPRSPRLLRDQNPPPARRGCESPERRQAVTDLPGDRESAIVAAAGRNCNARQERSGRQRCLRNGRDRGDEKCGLPTRAESTGLTRIIHRPQKTPRVHHCLQASSSTRT